MHNTRSVCRNWNKTLDERRCEHEESFVGRGAGASDGGGYMAELFQPVSLGVRHDFGNRIQEDDRENRYAQDKAFLRT